MIERPAAEGCASPLPIGLSHPPLAADPKPFEFGSQSHNAAQVQIPLKFSLTVAF